MLCVFRQSPFTGINDIFDGSLVKAGRASSGPFSGDGDAIADKSPPTGIFEQVWISGYIRLMKGRVFTYIWEFIVKDSKQRAFEKAYGPEGDWVMLFRKSQGYLGTELHQDQSNPLRYLTVDFWRSKEDRDAFRFRFAHEFQQLDARCESFTVQEKFLGDYDGFTSRVPTAE